MDERARLSARMRAFAEDHELDEWVAEAERLEAVEAAATALYDAYRGRCVAYFAEDGPGWGDRYSDAHGAHQDAEDALYALVCPGYDPEAWIPPALARDAAAR